MNRHLREVITNVWKADWTDGRLFHGTTDAFGCSVSPIRSNRCMKWVYAVDPTRPARPFAAAPSRTSMHHPRLLCNHSPLYTSHLKILKQIPHQIQSL